MVTTTLVGGTNKIYRVRHRDVDCRSDDALRREHPQGRRQLRAGKAVPQDGMLYAAYTHPETAFDLRSETGVSFEDTRKYTEPNVGNILNAAVGTTVVLTSSRLRVPTARLMVFLGAGLPHHHHRQAGACRGCAVEPGVRLGPVTDSMWRYQPVAWYGILGWARYRGLPCTGSSPVPSIASSAPTQARLPPRWPLPRHGGFVTWHISGMVDR